MQISQNVKLFLQSDKDTTCWGSTPKFFLMYSVVLLITVNDFDLILNRFDDENQLWKPKHNFYSFDKFFGVLVFFIPH